MTLAACGRDRDVYRCGRGVCDSRADGDADRARRSATARQRGLRTGRPRSCSPPQLRISPQRAAAAVRARRTGYRDSGRRTGCGRVQQPRGRRHSPRHGAGAGKRSAGTARACAQTGRRKHSSAPAPQRGDGARAALPGRQLDYMQPVPARSRDT